MNDFGDFRNNTFIYPPLSGRSMLTDTQIAELRSALEAAKNPLFLHDDDADGLCSFLLLYRLHREGKNMLVQAGPSVDARFLRKVREMQPDAIFILDVPIVEQEFIDGVHTLFPSCSIYWIDHHQPLEQNGVHYYNPRIKDPQAYIPTTRMAWQVSGREQDLWIAAAGCLADYYLPDFLDEFIKHYPNFLSGKTDLATALYKEPVGKLVKLFFFLLKGPASEVRQSIKVLSRLTSPDEIFQQQTAQGKFLCRRFEFLNKHYEELLQQARKAAGRGKVLLFHYTEKQWSFTANLANELASLYPQKVILICRKKGEEFKCSIRAGFPILPAVEHALQGVQGYGGGHENACGAVVHEKDWERFLEVFKAEVEKVQQ